MPIEMTMRDELIYAKFLQKGDVFRVSNGRPGAPHIQPKPTRTILEIRDADDESTPWESNPPVKMHIKTDKGKLVLREGVVVELLHRPGPLGKDLFQAVVVAAHEIIEAERGMVSTAKAEGDLLKAIEACELGIPYHERLKAAEAYKDLCEREERRRVAASRR